MSEITATDVFSFVNEVFSDEDSNLDLKTALMVIMESSRMTDPKEIVRSFGVVVDLYQRFCVEQVAKSMSDKRHTAVSQLHDASIVAQGGH